MKASDLFVKCLEQEGIQYVFGVPGEENADFILSLEASSKIEFVLTRHEQGAAFMAEAYGRLTGNPAGCLATLGPGATNLITGVADANMDRAPMLVITGQGSTKRLHKESHQIMDVVKMFEPVTKWSTSIRHPEVIPETIRKAVRLARGEKPGAVLVELPEDIAKAEVQASPLPVKRYQRSVPDQNTINRAYELIVQAKRPIIIAGNGCIRSSARDKLRELCNLTGIGVVSTFMGKGAVDVDAPYCLYTVGLSQKDLVSCALDAADLVITLGFDMVEYHPALWNGDRNKRIVHIDSTAAEIDACFQPEIELIGDLSTSLDVFIKQFKEAPLPDYDFTIQQSARRNMSEELSQHSHDITFDKIRPQKVLNDLRSVMKDDDLLLSDVGAHKMWIARHFHCHKPNTCLIPNGFCSMGFALPGAIAASLVSPERATVAICGDGGFMMNVQEMETAVRLESCLTVLVWEDKEYGLIAWKQRNEFERQSNLSFGNPDWQCLAQAFGWSCDVVAGSQSLKAVLSHAIANPGPNLVIIPIDYQENAKLTARLGNIVCPI